MESISKNCVKGERITSMNDITRLANERKSVYCDCWGIRPAAVIYSMQFKSVARIFHGRGFFFVHKK